VQLIKKIGQAVDNIIERVSSFFLLLGGLLALLIAIATTYAVFRRYALHNPEPYSYVISVVFFFTCVFLPLAAVQRQGRNIRVDFLANYFSQGIQHILLNILGPILALFYVIIGTWQYWKTAWYSLQVSEVSQQVLQIPLFPVKVMVPIGWGLLCLVLIAQLIRGVRLLRKGKYKMGQ
jgi:TRAP-type C4-dicarboxylate transport system permease small subunit